jgi:DNA-binding HxlR family transcriptional regulator
MVAEEIPPKALDARDCSIVAAVAELGDLWTILVLRELFLGARRFNEIQSDLGISRSVLANRLARLVDMGVVRAVPYQEPGDRVRHEYRPTRKGVGLVPLLHALKAWGDEHVRGVETMRVTDRHSGEEVRLEFRTTSGNRVQPNDIVAENVALADETETASGREKRQPPRRTPR